MGFFLLVLYIFFFVDYRNIKNLVIIEAIYDGAIQPATNFHNVI